MTFFPICRGSGSAHRRADADRPGGAGRLCGARLTRGTDDPASTLRAEWPSACGFTLVHASGFRTERPIQAVAERPRRPGRGPGRGPSEDNERTIDRMSVTAINGNQKAESISRASGAGSELRSRSGITMTTGTG